MEIKSLIRVILARLNMSKSILSEAHAYISVQASFHSAALMFINVAIPMHALSYLKETSPLPFSSLPTSFL